jgi:transcriptional regulator with XRE-family HTH domain
MSEIECINKYINKINQRIGENLRKTRKKKGISMAELGKLIGVSYQQIAKYEKGINTISFGRLLITCRILETDILQFVIPWQSYEKH